MLDLTYHDVMDCDTESELELVEWYLSKQTTCATSRKTSNGLNQQCQSSRCESSTLALSNSEQEYSSCGDTLDRKNPTSLTRVAEKFSKVNPIEFPFDSSTLRYSCLACDRTFLSRYAVRSHYDSVHLHKVYPCTQCPRVFINPRRRRRHIQSQHERFPTLVSCPFTNCSKTFSNPVALVEHKYSAHKSTAKSHQKCHLCGKDFAFRKASLQKHILQCHSPQSDDGFFRCLEQSCHWMSKSYTHLRVHMRHHQESLPPFSCDRPDCNEKFFSFADLAIHRRSGHHNSSLMCTTCSKVFLTFKRFEKHLRDKHTFNGTHQQDNNDYTLFTCPISSCGKIFSSSRNIRHHIIHGHLLLKSYQCRLCLSLFTSSNAAGHHIKMFHQKHLNDSDGLTHIEVLYNVPFLNTEEAVRRVCAAFEHQAVPEDFLKSGGIGLQFQRNHVVETLNCIAHDPTFDLLTVKRRRKPQNDKRESLLLNGNHSTEATAVSSSSISSRNINIHKPSKTHRRCQRVKRSEDEISLAVEGEVTSILKKHICLHRKEKKISNKLPAVV